MKRKLKSSSGGVLVGKPVQKKKMKPNLSSIVSTTRVSKNMGKTSKKKKRRTDFSSLSVDDFMSKVVEDSDSDDDESSTNVNNGVAPKNGNGRVYIADEAEEGEEALDDSSVADEADDEEEDEAENCAEFIDDQAEEDNTFREDDDSVDEDDDEEDNNSDVAGSEEDDSKDYADLPASVDDENDDDEGMSATSHKKSLQKLQDTDPEFYKYLEANDKKLLQFNVSDSDSDEEEEKYHKPDEDLEVASEDSDFEADTEVEVQEGVITMKMIREWQENIQTDKSLGTIADVVSGFHAALIRVTSADEPCKFKVDGSAVFNGVVQLCVLELQPALKRFLHLPSGSAGKHIQLQKCKKWKKIKPQLKSYLQNLLRLLSGVSSPHIISVLLKHMHQMTPFIVCFPPIARKAIKQLITIWGSGEDATRIIAFLCILRLANTDHSLLDSVLKQMYLSYVSNCKFTSPSTLAGINFMRRSLVEMFSLNDSMSYQHVFLYIRQLAIHLRNAVTLQKKESTQAVLNWQFVHSLHLWSDLLGVNTPSLQPLLYPLVQIMIGTVKLIPTTQYFPLRFHLTQMLIELSHCTNTFIPILPFLLEILTSYDMNKRHKKVSMKPMDLKCVLRVSKTEQTENSFKDAVVELIYQQMLQYLAQEAHCIGYPDIAILPLMQLRKFLKVCKVSNYCKKFRSLVDKMEENSRWIEKARNGTNLVLSDRKAVEAWETSSKLRGPPLAAFYASFHTVNKRMLAKRATDSDKLGEYNIPVMKKHSKKQEGDDKPVVLFPSDDESDSDSRVSSEEIIPPKKKAKRTKKVKVKLPSELQSHQDEDGIQEDIVQDLKIEDF